VPSSPNPHELNDIVAFIGAQQAHLDRRIGYVGTDVVGIVAELDALDPSWVSTDRRHTLAVEMSDYTAANRANWDDPVPIHIARSSTTSRGG
jgi:hypothetical protein